MAQVIDDGGFGRPILTQDTIARIASVLADPATAWRAEPADRRRAHARYRGRALPPGADENRINAELEQLMGADDTDDTPDHLRHWVANAGIRVSCLVTHLQSLDLEGDPKELLAAVLHPEQEIRP